MNEYYQLLGLTPEATDEEIKIRYEELKKKYREEMWQDGDAGTQAAKMLGKLDTAFRELNDLRHEKAQNTEGTTAYEEVSALLKEGKLNEAQQKLDDFNERGAEWHYLQAVVFYKKSWNSESKKQLEIAIQLDPENKKYRNAYGKLNQKTEYEKQTAHKPKDENYAPVDDGPQMGGNACSNCMSCCYACLCVDCLYSTCCGCRQ